MTAPYLRGFGDVNATYGLETAVVVLGCTVGERGELTASALRRVKKAAEVALAHRELAVVASGGRRWGPMAEATAMARGLVDEGVAEERIVRELVSLTTRENARYSAPLLRRRGIRRVLLVTCDYHLPRARSCFEEQGFSVVGIEAPSRRLPLGREVYRRVREKVAFVLDRSW